MNKLDLGAVTAYAMAVEQGYEGTEEEFAALMANSGNNALRAENAADRAQQVLDSIPLDFQEVSQGVATLSKEIDTLCIYSEAEYELDIDRESHYMDSSEIPQLAAWEGANVSSPIHLKKGQMITTLAETNDAITPIVYCDEHARGPYTAMLRWSANVNFAIAEEDCYVLITYLKDSPVKKYKIADTVKQEIGDVEKRVGQKINDLCIYSEAEYELQVGRDSHYVSAGDPPELTEWEGAYVSTPIHLKKGQMITTLSETNDAITPIVFCDKDGMPPFSAMLRYDEAVNYAVAERDCYVLVTYLKDSPVKKCKITDTVKMDSGNKLSGLKIVYNGDSIGAHPYGYPYQVAQMTGGTYENNSVSGGTLAVRDGVHNVCTSVSSMAADADIVCFEGGINDYWMNIPLGDYSESDFSGAVDNTTVCGALESIFRQAAEKWVGKPIVFIIVHKITTTAWTHNNAAVPYTFAHARDKMLGICKKYSIPVLDMWESGGLNAYIPALNAAYLNGGARPADGCHPDENGYKKYYVPRLISLFESVTP